MEFDERDWLELSGLQKFSVCRRQWAIVCLERQWKENFFTVDGSLMHKSAHDTQFRESRGDRVIVHGMEIHSPTLGVSGICDVVEFHRVTNPDEGIPLREKEGFWKPFPVEYKRGKPSRHTEADTLQLCGQAMCLEEMLCCCVPCGALYYGETRRRQEVNFTPLLRAEVKKLLGEMHDLYRRGTTPKVKPSKSCSACSERELCLPKLNRTRSAADYIRQHWEGCE